MTQYERMVKGLLYDPGDLEIMKEQSPFQDKLWEFNQLKPSDVESKEKYMKDIPDNVVAVGNPCKVMREVSERDKRYFYRDELIDHENLENIGIPL